MNSIFSKKSKDEKDTIDSIASLSHTKWNCKYHIVFTPKYRRKIFYGQKRMEIGKILRDICDWQEVKIIEAEVCPDHVHMFVSIPPKLSVSKFMGILKGKSSLIIFQRWSNLKYKFGQRSFWCRGYYVDTVGKNAKVIAEYVRNQLKEDMMLSKNVEVINVQLLQLLECCLLASIICFLKMNHLITKFMSSYLKKISNLKIKN